jgi:hypothetical protein
MKIRMNRDTKRLFISLSIYLLLVAILTWPSYTSESTRIAHKGTDSSIYTWVGNYQLIVVFVMYFLGFVMIMNFSNWITEKILDRKRDVTTPYEEIRNDLMSHGMREIDTIDIVIKWIDKFELIKFKKD